MEIAEDTLISRLSDLRVNDAGRFGPKAAWLGHLSSRKFQVPEGFALSTRSWLEARNLERPLGVPEALQRELLRWFDDLGATTVAVRSSAAYEDGSLSSWAGQLETVLGVGRDRLIAAVERVWNSAFAPRAQAYAKGNAPDGGVGVIVQSLVASEYSGVVFSLDPVTADPDVIVVEAVAGLGEALVAGSVTPAHYRISRGSFLVQQSRKPAQERQLRVEGSTPRWIETDIGDIPDDVALRAAKMVVEVEGHLGQPADMEWAVANDTFFVLQARPITAIGNKAKLSSPTLRGFKRMFSAANVNLLATDVHMRVYDRYQVVMVQVDGRYEKWSGPDGLRLSSSEGFALYRSPNMVAALEDEANYLLANTIDKLMDAARDQSRTGRADFFRESDRFINTYRYFNSEFVDDVVVAAKDDPQLNERIQLVLKFKNPLRDVLNKAYFDPQGPMMILAVNAAAAAQRDVEDILYCSSQEVISLAIPDSAEIGERKTAYAQFSVDNELAVLSGGAACDVRSTAEAVTRDTLHGMVANAPVARFVGRAFVMNVDFSDVTAIGRIAADIPPGAILVCPSTGPEVSEVCKKSGAILNEIGGQLTHAMLISREEGLPCIVGIDGLCDVVQAGDLLELDLETGRVTILDSAGEVG